MINGNIDSKAYQHVYVIDDKGEEKDITEGGILSCAYFVSSLLLIHKLINSVHATVNSTLKDMTDNGWHEISDLKVGAILLWEPDQEGSGLHRHLGFYVGENMAISNSSTDKIVKIHDINFGDRNRKIEKIFWHDSLST